MTSQRYGQRPSTSCQNFLASRDIGLTPIQNKYFEKKRVHQANSSANITYDMCAEPMEECPSQADYLTHQSSHQSINKDWDPFCRNYTLNRAPIYNRSNSSNSENFYQIQRIQPPIHRPHNGFATSIDPIMISDEEGPLDQGYEIKRCQPSIQLRNAIISKIHQKILMKRLQNQEKGKMEMCIQIIDQDIQSDNNIEIKGDIISHHQPTQQINPTSKKTYQRITRSKKGRCGNNLSTETSNDSELVEEGNKQVSAKMIKVARYRYAIPEIAQKISILSSIADEKTINQKQNAVVPRIPCIPTSTQHHTIFVQILKFQLAKRAIINID